MNRQFKHVFSLALLAAGLHVSVLGGSLRKVWEVDLTAAVESRVGRKVSRPGITALRFSPDGARIAVAVEGYLKNQESRLLVVKVQDPHNQIQQFELGDKYGADDSDLLPSRSPAIAWSPGGDLILAAHGLFRTKEGKACALPGNNGAGFISAARIIALSLRKPLRFEFYDAECRPDGNSETDEALTAFVDVSPERGLVSLLRGSGELLVMDPIAKTVVQRWPEIETGYIARFANSGKILCAGEGGDYSAPPERPPRCMDVDTGKTIAEAAGIKGGPAFAAAQRASRVVASDHRASWNVLFHEDDSVLRRRVVWDVRKNVEIASWKPESQTYDTGGPRPIKAPFMFAISPDGEYIAEGGNGILRLYKIEP